MALVFIVYSRVNLLKVLALEYPDNTFVRFDFRYYTILAIIFPLYLSLFSEQKHIRKMPDIIDTAFSLHLSANIFVFWDFNAHHDTCLKHSNVTDVASM